MVTIFLDKKKKKKKSYVKHEYTRGRISTSHDLLEKDPNNQTYK